MRFFMIYIIIFAVFVLLYMIFIRPKLLRLALSSITVITGAVKTGKSALMVHLAKRAYIVELRRYYVICFFCTLFRRNKPEKPLLYSNIPLRNLPYVPVTVDLLQRKVRPAFRSILIFDEVTFMADSQLYRDQQINYELLAFYKLFGHETHGGSLFISTHVLSEVHMSLRRTCGSILYINWSTRHVPLLTVFSVRKLLADVDESTVNTVTDIDSESKYLFVSKRVFKYYDKFCYSIFTDELPVKSDIHLKEGKDSLKQAEIPTFNRYLTSILETEKENENKK